VKEENSSSICFDGERKLQKQWTQEAFLREQTAMKRDQLIPWAKPDLSNREQEYLSQALSSTWISGGPFVERFENEFARFCGSSRATTASNGTAALHMAYLAMGLGPGDEVILPGFAFMAAANVALHVRAKPVFTEVDPSTWCLTANAIERVLSPKTKLIVPIHTYGGMCAMDEILDLATRTSVPVLEDAAEALGSRYKDVPAGNLGLLGTFSFHATKTITTGEGGAVITESEALHDRLNLYRNHGIDQTRYWHKVPGHNFRMTNLQAAVGCAQLGRIDTITLERRRVYDSYQKYLSNVPGVTMQGFAQGVVPLVWAVAVKLDPKAYPQGRDTLIRQLRESNIETRNGFYSASMLPHLYTSLALPVCEDLSRQVISFPSYGNLEDLDIQFICSSLDRLRR
jgi:perosamine synthetase